MGPSNEASFDALTQNVDLALKALRAPGSRTNVSEFWTAVVLILSGPSRSSLVAFRISFTQEILSGHKSVDDQVYKLVVTYLTGLYCSERW